MEKRFKMNFNKNLKEIEKIIPGFDSETPIQKSKRITEYNLWPTNAPAIVSFAKYKQKELSDLFSGKTLIDLGCGRNGFGYSCGKLLRIKNYIGVDPILKYLDSSELKYLNSFNNKKIKFFGIAEDMLSFLKRLPNDSSNFISSFIDYDILEGNFYREEVEKEIYRTLHPKGFYLSYASKIFPPIQCSSFKDERDTLVFSKDINLCKIKPEIYRNKLTI